MKSLRVLLAFVVCWYRLTLSIEKPSPSPTTTWMFRIEPEQQRLAVRGKIILRNDSASQQKNLSLRQISSSLDWRSIQLDGKPAQSSPNPIGRNIDHTGALSEAIITLPKEIPPKGAVELEVGYEGVIPLDATG